MTARRCGVLLHPTSLPGAGMQGNFGADAYRFVDFLARAGMSWWQVLPMGPVHRDLSPYNSLSAFAGNPRLLAPDDIDGLPRLNDRSGTVTGPEELRALLGSRLRQFQQEADAGAQRDFTRFKRRHRHWLDDYALFSALRRQFDNDPWFRWPAPVRRRQRDALEESRGRLSGEMELSRFKQFLFYRQWGRLRDHARDRGVSLMGDMPFFVAHDSADVWANQPCFALDEAGQPTAVAGVPPDYFSAAGQRWGNPLYDWKAMEADGFLWWQRRVAHLSACFDLLRIDHFRGLESVWGIPAGEPTAEFGRWVGVPGRKLLGALQKQFHELPFVAEDLGLITREVKALRDDYGLPGTVVLQFAFDSDGANPYLPHNHRANSVVYTGTHDNDTTLGWYRGLDDATRHRVNAYLGYPAMEMPWPLIHGALASVANLTIIPWQDLLAMDGDCRMNTPGTLEGNNWKFRFQWNQVPDGLAEGLGYLLSLYGRRDLHHSTHGM